MPPFVEEDWLAFGYLRNFAGDNVMKKQVRLLTSAIAASLAAVVIVEQPAAAETCLTRPNVRAGGHWVYLSDRARQQKCWFRQTVTPEVRTAVAAPTSTATPS